MNKLKNTEFQFNYNFTNSETLKMKNLHTITGLFFFCALASCQSQTEKAEGSIVVAHRGASHYAPENTVAAAELAWEQNADAVEVDVHLTSDNQIAVMHDYNTKRTTGKMFKISDTPMDSLRTLEAGGFKAEKYRGEPVPVLSEIVETVPAGKKLFVEIKSDKKIVPVLKQKFGDHPKLDQFVFIAFNYETIVAAKKAFPKNEAYWLSSKFKEDMKTEMQRVKDDGLDGVDLNYKIITPDLMAAAKELELGVHVWTVDDLEKAKELQKMGVIGITTNMPDKVLAALDNSRE